LLDCLDLDFDLRFEISLDWLFEDGIIFVYTSASLSCRESFVLFKV